MTVSKKLDYRGKVARWIKSDREEGVSYNVRLDSCGHATLREEMGRFSELGCLGS